MIARTLRVGYNITMKKTPKNPTEGKGATTLKEHLDRIRKIAHETQRNNGHFQRMADGRRVKSKTP